MRPHSAPRSSQPAPDDETEESSAAIGLLRHALACRATDIHIDRA
jgi:hypothetical protein